jgi:hypothetical protein
MMRSGYSSSARPVSRVNSCRATSSFHDDGGDGEGEGDWEASRMTGCWLVYDSAGCYYHMIYFAGECYSSDGRRGRYMSEDVHLSVLFVRIEGRCMMAGRWCWWTEMMRKGVLHQG